MNPSPSTRSLRPWVLAGSGLGAALCALAVPATGSAQALSSGPVQLTEAATDRADPGLRLRLGLAGEVENAWGGEARDRTSGGLRLHVGAQFSDRAAAYLRVSAGSDLTGTVGRAALMAEYSPTSWLSLGAGLGVEGFAPGGEPLAGNGFARGGANPGSLGIPLQLALHRLGFEPRGARHGVTAGLELTPGLALDARRGAAFAGALFVGYELR